MSFEIDKIVRREDKWHHITDLVDENLFPILKDSVKAEIVQLVKDEIELDLTFEQIKKHIAYVNSLRTLRGRQQLLTQKILKE